jgi:hypothetical protein
MLNTSFESGNRHWYTSTRGDSYIIQRVPAMARTGSWLAILGDFPDEVMFIRQTVYVPRSRSTLSFHYKINSNELCGKFYDDYKINSNELCGKFYDVAYVILNGNPANGWSTGDYRWTLDVCRYQSSNRWQLATINLSRYAGKYINVHFIMTTDYSNHSAWFIDDVGWR